MANSVLCLCCNQQIPRQREREHRKQMANPSPSNAVFAGVPSRQRRITLLDLDEELETQPGLLDPNIFPNLPDPREDVALHMGTDERSHADANHESVEDEPTGLTLGPEGQSLSGAVDPQYIIRQRWKPLHWDQHRQIPSDSESDTGSTDDSAGEHLLDGDGGDDDGDGPIDWAAVEQGLGLPAWDRLGEGYEMEATNVGK